MWLNTHAQPLGLVVRIERGVCVYVSWGVDEALDWEEKVDLPGTSAKTRVTIVLCQVIWWRGTVGGFDVTAPSLQQNWNYG